MKTPVTKYFQASSQLDEHQQEIDKTRKYVDDSIAAIRLQCQHVFEVCWGDPTNPESWKTVPGDQSIVADAHTLCVWCGTPGGGEDSWQGIRAKVAEEAKHLEGMTIEEYDEREGRFFAPGRNLNDDAIY